MKRILILMIAILYVSFTVFAQSELKPIKCLDESGTFELELSGDDTWTSINVTNLSTDKLVFSKDLLKNEAAKLFAVLANSERSHIQNLVTDLDEPIAFVNFDDGMIIEINNHQFLGCNK